MRRQLLFIGILLCALLLSGWGSVLSAALCPHAESLSSAPTEEVMEEDHACCPAKSEKTDAHCSSSSHEAMEDEAVKPVTERHARQDTDQETSRHAQHAEACWHCVRHSNLPPTRVQVRESYQSKREANDIPSHEVRPVPPSVVRFVSKIIPTQGSPPERTARRHLLLSVFLI